MAEEVNRTDPDLFYSDKLKYWQRRYDVGDTFWMRKEAAPMLVKYYNRLNPDGKANKILLPMCGKTFSLDWLSSQNIPLVVGVDCILSVLQEVCSRSDQDWTTTSKSEFTLLERIDSRMKLYCGDMLQFLPEIEGTFDIMWERGGIIVLPPKDVSRYVEVLKSVLNSGGRILLESIEFDKEAVDLSEDYAPFPPFPYFLKDLTSLFAPECTVERLDSSPCNWKYGKISAEFVTYFISKKEN